jgi:apolipoprotein N-acyltransferase
LQGNIPQDEKFDQSSGVPNALRWYGQQLNASQTSLIVTPETALALLPDELPPGYWQALQQRFAIGKQAALVGLPLGSYQAGYTNSVVGLKPGQATPWQYDKHHLVPFGEFIPPLFRWFTNLMNIPLGDFNRGGLPQPTFDWQGQRLATSICYENLFSEELAAQFIDAALAPTMLVNISNLGWFGEHVAMDHHLHIARVRALEFDRPFLLATNTGRTAVVDHLGQVVKALPNHVAQALNATVEGRTGITPYAWWASRWGQWPLVIVALLVIALGWFLSKQPYPQSLPPPFPAPPGERRRG